MSCYIHHTINDVATLLSRIYCLCLPKTSLDGGMYTLRHFLLGDQI
jgi:hypothetical protein